MYLGGPLGLMSIGLMAILVRGLGLLMLGVASTAGQLLGSVLIDVLIPSLGNTVYPETAGSTSGTDPVRGGIAEKPGYNGRGRFGTEKRDGPD